MEGGLFRALSYNYKIISIYIIITRFSGKQKNSTPPRIPHKKLKTKIFKICVLHEWKLNRLRERLIPAEAETRNKSGGIIGVKFFCFRREIIPCPQRKPAHGINALKKTVLCSKS
jgi:hypothetical protein